jgi:hypothetical protein
MAIRGIQTPLVEPPAPAVWSTRRGMVAVASAGMVRVSARKVGTMEPKRLSRFMLFGLLVIVGVCAIGLGAAVFATAHTVHPVELDGIIADYKEISVDGMYAHNELRLAGDSHSYILDRRQLHPDLPERLLKDGKVTIWVDRGTTTILAISLYDQLGLNPASYTSDDYDNPALSARFQQMKGGATAGIGLAVLVLAIVWLLGRSRGPTVRGRRAHLPTTAGRAPVGAPVGGEASQSQQRAPTLVGARQEQSMREPYTQAAALDRTAMPTVRGPGHTTAGGTGDIDQIATVRTPAITPVTGAAADHPTAPPAQNPERAAAAGLADIDQLATVRTPAIQSAANDAIVWPAPGDPYGMHAPATLTPESAAGSAYALRAAGAPAELGFDQAGASSVVTGPLPGAIDQQPTVKTAVVQASDNVLEGPPAPLPAHDEQRAAGSDPAAHAWAAGWGLPLPEGDSDNNAARPRKRLTPLSLSSSGQHGEQPPHPWGMAWGVPAAPTPIEEQPTERTPAVPPARDARDQPPDQHTGRE